MKKTIVALLLVTVLMVGCSQSIPSQAIPIQATYTFEKVVINTYYQEPTSLKDSKTIVLNGLMEGEFIEVIVDGEIKDFKHVELTWDDKQNTLVETRIINEFDTLTDKTIVIKTYMPEGIPSEKIVWKTKSEQTYEFIIAQE